MTHDVTGVRALVQKAAQENIVLHEMDVKAAYLHAPMDCEVFMIQSEGHDVKSDTN